jgi:hypothetical protein
MGNNWRGHVAGIKIEEKYVQNLDRENLWEETFV